LLFVLSLYGLPGSGTKGFAAPPQMSPIGFGSLVAHENGESRYELVLEGHNHFKQKTGPFGFRQYGVAESRLELGSDFGITLDAISGVTILGITKDEKFHPFVGIEPFSGKIDLNSSDSRTDYYEWLPMGSVGIQFAIRTCRILPLVRAGGGIGNLKKSGLSPALRAAYGPGFHFNCSGFNFAAELTRVETRPNPVEFASLDLAIRLSKNGWEAGLRGESIASRLPGQNPYRNPFQGNEASEKRILLVFRGNLFDLQ